MLFARIAALSALAAGCASAVPPAAAGTATARLGEQVRIGGVAVRPLRVDEDSRCPASVQCVHAGTVRLAVRLSESGRTREAVLRLGVPEPLGRGRYLRLAAVCPYPARPAPIAPLSYRFVFAQDSEPDAVPPLRDCPRG